MKYSEKDRNQWTPDDVAEAIADGYYERKPQPPTTPTESLKYLQNREKRLMAVQMNIAAIGEARGQHPFEIASQYWPELQRVRREIRRRIAEKVRLPKAA